MKYTIYLGILLLSSPLWCGAREMWAPSASQEWVHTTHHAPHPPHDHHETDHIKLLDELCRRMREDDEWESSEWGL